MRGSALRIKKPKYLRMRTGAHTGVIAILLTAFCLSCNSDHDNSQYLHLITEMHMIECNALKNAGVTFAVNTGNIYEFRSIAFDRIMTRPDAKLIAHWEDLNHELAVIEHYLDDKGKMNFSADFANVYLKPCK